VGRKGKVARWRRGGGEEEGKGSDNVGEGTWELCAGEYGGKQW